LPRHQPISVPKGVEGDKNGSEQAHQVPSSPHKQSIVSCHFSVFLREQP
jgi:hypothetical protein